MRLFGEASLKVRPLIAAPRIKREPFKFVALALGLVILQDEPVEAPQRRAGRTATVRGYISHRRRPRQNDIPLEIVAALAGMDTRVDTVTSQ